jgi:hypothetical protein
LWNTLYVAEYGQRGSKGNRTRPVYGRRV